MMYNKKPFKRYLVDPNNHNGWVVDLSPSNVVNPDFYWYFPTLRAAQHFIRLLNNGYNAREAQYIVSLTN